MPASSELRNTTRATVSTHGKKKQAYQYKIVKYKQERDEILCANILKWQYRIIPYRITLLHIIAYRTTSSDVWSLHVHVIQLSFKLN